MHAGVRARDSDQAGLARLRPNKEKEWERAHGNCELTSSLVGCGAKEKPTERTTRVERAAPHRGIFIVDVEY